MPSPMSELTDALSAGKARKVPADIDKFHSIVASFFLVIPLQIITKVRSGPIEAEIILTISKSIRIFSTFPVQSDHSRKSRRARLPILGRCHSGLIAEGTIEWSGGTVSEIHGNSNDRLICRVEELAGSLDSITVQEFAEVTKPQFLIDDSSQYVFGDAGIGSKGANGESFPAIQFGIFKSHKQSAGFFGVSMYACFTL